MPVNSKVAFVVDALPYIGGAEKVLMAALELFPHAPIYTLVYNPQAFSKTAIAGHQVFTSYINELPMARTQYKKYLPLMPHAVSQFNLSQYDIILSFSYAVAHGIRTLPGQLHYSYTYTPMRYAWRDIGLNGAQKVRPSLFSSLFRPFRDWDAAVTADIERLASVSKWIGCWVKRAYKRDSTVIYPPVHVERFCPAKERDGFYITVSRLVQHKRLDLMIQAFNNLGLPLIIVGDGPERRKLENLAGPTVRLAGYCSDAVVTDLLNRARAFVCTAEEDFGIAAVEAQAAGCPVIAYEKGGLLETVTKEKTGLFFAIPTVGSLTDAVERFEQTKNVFDAREIAKSVQHFNKARFLDEFSTFIGTE